jgi:hypothetical protein
MHWITLKSTTNITKYTINTAKCIKKRFKYYGVFLFTIKNTFLCFNIHTHTFQIHVFLTHITISLLYSNILPYTSIYVETVMKPHLFVLSLHYFSKLSWCFIILPKCCCTCNDMFIGIQKWSIIHKSYWLI